MTTAIFHSPTTLREYFSDLGKAARAFAAALFAAQERQFVVQEIVVKPAKATRRSTVREHSQLIELARQYQDMQPNLAAELRSLASRG